MLNSIIDFKNSVIKRFGAVLGYIILIVGGLIALSILGFLLKTLFSIVIGLAVAGLAIFGVCKAFEAVNTRKSS